MRTAIIHSYDIPSFMLAPVRVFRYSDVASTNNYDLSAQLGRVVLLANADENTARNLLKGRNRVA